MQQGKAGTWPGPGWEGQALSDSPLTPPHPEVDQVLGPTLGTHDLLSLPNKNQGHQGAEAGLCNPILNSAALTRGRSEDWDEDGGTEPPGGGVNAL